MVEYILYIDEKKADLGDFQPKITRQRNDFASLQEVKSDFATVTLPPSKNNKIIFEHVEIWGSSSTVPYKYLDARLYIDGELFTPFGKLVLDEIDKDGFYECVIYTGVFPLFDTLKNLKMEDLDLSEYSHFLTLSEVTTRNANPTDVFYPIFNDGYGISGNVTLDRLVPFIKNDVLAIKIFALQGFTLSGTFIESTELTEGCTACLGNVTRDVFNNANPPKIGYDMTQSDFIKTLMESTNSIVTSIDYFTNTIEINTLESISSNPPVKIEVDEIISQSFDLSEVGQRNYFKYENEDNKTIGQNILEINNTRLDVEKDVIESDIKALEQSSITLDSETETVDTIYVFEDEEKVRDNLEEGNISKYRQEINNEDLFVSLYQSVNKNITYQEPKPSKLDEYILDSSIFPSGIHIDGNNMYICDSNNGDIGQYDISNGLSNAVLVDEYQTGASGIKGISKYGDSLYYVNSSFDTLTKIDIPNGLSNPTNTYTAFLSNSGVTTAEDISVTDNHIYIINSFDDRIYRFNRSDNLVPLSTDQNTYVGNFDLSIFSMDVVGDNIYLGGTINDIIYKLDITNGLINKTLDSTLDISEYDGSVRGISLNSGFIYIVGSDNRTVYKIDNRYDFIQNTSNQTQFIYSNFSNLNWSVLNPKYYTTWKAIFEDYRQLVITSQLTGQEVNDFDFKNPVYLSNEFGNQKFLMEIIENYQKDKPTKLRLLKI